MSLTPSQRFTLIILAITIMSGLLGWLLRSLWSSQTSATRANTDALQNLTDAVGKLDSRMSRIEGRMEGGTGRRAR